jgi:lactoylglutathione lyase
MLAGKQQKKGHSIEISPGKDDSKHSHTLVSFTLPLTTVVRTGYFLRPGYWVELVQRGENSGIANEYNFSQTMLRIKDPKKSLDFYQRLGLKLLAERHFDDFSLYFLGGCSSSNSASSDAAGGAHEEVKTRFAPVLELTHNHGTETDDNFRHFNGNEEGRQGFGHIGFLVDE